MNDNSKNKIKIGIFGGKFDPFTAAHYEIVKKVLSDRLVDKVIIMPTTVDYYRKDDEVLFSRDERKTIILKWFEEVGFINTVILDFHEYDLLDLNKSGLAGSRRYIDMLRYAYELYCSYGDVEFYTILGNDSFKNFKTWTAWKEILKLSKLIVVNRYEHDIYGGSLDIRNEYCHIDEKFWNVSSTEIRKRLIDECSGMSIGPSATPLNLYLEEIERYKKREKIRKDELEEIECDNPTPLNFYLEDIERNKKSEKNREDDLEEIECDNPKSDMNVKANEDVDQEVKNLYAYAKAASDRKMSLRRNEIESEEKEHRISEIEFESLRDKALDMARTLKLIEKEAHECAMCSGQKENGYSAEDFLKNVCYLLLQSQGYYKEEL